MTEKRKNDLQFLMKNLNSPNQWLIMFLKKTPSIQATLLPTPWFFLPKKRNANQDTHPLPKILPPQSTHITSATAIFPHVFCKRQEKVVISLREKNNQHLTTWQPRFLPEKLGNLESLNTISKLLSGYDYKLAMLGHVAVVFVDNFDAWLPFELQIFVGDDTRNKPGHANGTHQWWKMMMSRHLYAGKMICTSWWTPESWRLAKLTASYVFLTCFRVANLPTYFHHKHVRNTSMFFWGRIAKLRIHVDTQRKWPSHSTVVLWTTRFAKILWTCPEGNHFPSFRTEKSNMIFLQQKTLRKALLWWKVASSSWVPGIPFAFGCFETKLPGCILKSGFPRDPKINQMNPQKIVF